MALEDAGLHPSWSNPHTAGVIMGTAGGSFKEGLEQQSILLERGAERINPFLSISSMNINALSAEVALTTQSKGPAFTIMGACASSLYTLAIASDMIRSGTLDVCMTGGVESPISPLLISCLCRLQELTTSNAVPEHASCPFDKNHNGLVPSEGCCILILEERTHAEQRGAHIYGEIIGYALGCDAYTAYSLEPTGESAAHTLQQALAQADVTPNEIEWVNAHGSSCPDWDRKETRVLKRALGEAAYTIPISATKSMTGHAFGAAGSFQVASTVLAMQNGCVPPTINLNAPDPECDLDYIPHNARTLSPKICLVESFGYGGLNSFLLLRQESS
jgi:3-oxoacyl-[acyl-carrier-protein] synthase II